jgi:hypothetical protein
MTKPPRELLEFLSRHEPGLRAAALGLRRVVLEEMAPCHEYIFAMRGTVVLLYGPTDRVIEDCICMITVYRKHMNLQFTHGTELNDSYGVLQGTGKRMRHVTVKNLSGLDRPEIRAYLRQARKHAGLTRPRQRKARRVMTVVKARPTERRPPAARDGLVMPGNATHRREASAIAASIRSLATSAGRDRTQKWRE